MDRPAVFKFIDYRAYLRAMFDYHKATVRHFSYRYFARKAGFAAPNFIKLVMDGKRNLSSASISKIAKGFTLKKKERDFLENLVLMNQAADHEERNFYYKKMLSLNGDTGAAKIEKEQYEYFSKWYYPVIRELVTFGDRRYTPAEIAAMLNPPITEHEARKALKLLANLKMIRLDAHGCWRQCNDIISTGPEVKSMAVANFHREMIRLGAEAIERVPARERDISALTISIDSGRLTDLKEKIAQFRREILDLAHDEKRPDQVIQMNLQLFPLSNAVNKEDD